MPRTTATGSSTTTACPKPSPAAQTWANNVQDWESSDDNTNLAYLDRLQARPLRQPLRQDLQVPVGPRARPQRPPHPQHVHERHGGQSRRADQPLQPPLRPVLQAGRGDDPSGIFVFLDEHADTLNDGFFVNLLDDYAWGNLPGSYHNGAVNLAFADGHLETHRWLVPDTVRPVLRTRIDKFPAAPPRTLSGSRRGRA